MAEPNTRSVFFSFHYDRDIMRVQQVKNHYVTKLGYEAAGYFDGSLAELAKTEGKSAVKRAINRGLPGSSVTCVLIGAETYQRHWVDYEIFRSIELGKGIIGIRIHQIKDPRTGADNSGPNPFDFLGYSWNEQSQMLVPYAKYRGVWKKYEDADPITASSATYLPRNSVTLSSLFIVYDWVLNSGYSNFSDWISRAGKQAGR